MSQENIDNFVLICGCNVDAAKACLQRNGNNFDVAISSWFENGEGADQGPFVQPNQQNQIQQPVQPKAKALPLSFRERKMKFQHAYDDDIGVSVLPGLYNKKDNVIIPLKALFVKAKIRDFIADVEVCQRFVNEQAHPIEAVFRFENHSAELTNFEVTINDKVFKGICKDKREAQDDYDDSIAQGHGAYMVEKDKTEGTFKVSIGNLSPQKECVLKMRYVSELEVDEDYLKFTLPVTACRLQKSNDGKPSGLGVTLDLKMPSNIEEIFSVSHKLDSKIDEKSGLVKLLDQASNAGRDLELFIKLQSPHEPVSYIEVFNPKIRSKGLLANQNNSKVDENNIVVEDPVFEIGPQPGTHTPEFDFGPQPGSGTDPFLLDFGPQPGTGNAFLDAFGPQPGSFFSIDGFPQPGGGGGFIGFDDPVPQPIQREEPQVEPEQPIANQMPVQVASKMRFSDAPHAVMISLFPKIESDDDTLCEVIFLVDRSGSMSGSRMNQAKNALQLFLRSLPFGTLFNIVGFGTTMVKLFPESIALNEQTLNKATEHVNEMQANLIGTKILPPLQDILSRPVNSSFPRQVFCITDGEVENTQEVLNYVKKTSTLDSRIFTFGIGAEASKSLVNGIAKYGRGRSEFVVSGERMEAKVMGQLKSALQPILKDIKVDWSDLNVVPQFQNLQNYYPPIFDGDRLIVYTFVRGDELFGCRTARITATTGEQTFKWDVEVDMQRHALEGSHIHRLAAANFTKALEKDAKNNRKLISQLGTTWGIVTKYTSYVAVEEREYTEAVTDGMKLVDVNETISQNRHFASDRLSNLQPEPLSMDMDFAEGGGGAIRRLSRGALGGRGGVVASAARPKSAKKAVAKGPGGQKDNKVKRKKSTGLQGAIKASVAADDDNEDSDNLASDDIHSESAFRSVYSADEQMDVYAQAMPESDGLCRVDMIDTHDYSSDGEEEIDESDAPIMLANKMMQSARSQKEAEEMECYAREEEANESANRDMKERIEVRKRELSEKKASAEAEEMQKYACEESANEESSRKMKHRVESRKKELSEKKEETSLFGSIKQSLFGDSSSVSTNSMKSESKDREKTKSESMRSASPRMATENMPCSQSVSSSSFSFPANLSNNNNNSTAYNSNNFNNNNNRAFGPPQQQNFGQQQQQQPQQQQQQQQQQQYFGQPPSRPLQGMAAPSFAQPMAPMSFMSQSMAQPQMVKVEKHSMMRPQDCFIVLQNADGSFSLRDQFLSETKLSKEKILTSLPQFIKDLKDFNDDEKVTFWVTAIAIAFLEKTFEETRIEWDLISDKSVKYLNKKLRQFGVHEKIRIDAVSFLA